MVSVGSRKAQLESMQTSKHVDFERDLGRDSVRSAKVLSNPTTIVRAPAPSANSAVALASVAEQDKAYPSNISGDQ